jgi:hypothetical protein
MAHQDFRDAHFVSVTSQSGFSGWPGPGNGPPPCRFRLFGTRPPLIDGPASITRDPPGARQLFPAGCLQQLRPTPRPGFLIGSFPRLGLSAVPRETHRHVADLAVPWRGCILPCHYLHNRERKLVTSQEVILVMVTPPGEESPLVL